MTQTLRIYIDARWPTPAKAAWVLLGSNGLPLRDGVSEPVHWPAADDHEIVLGSAQATWLATRLPPGKAGRGDMGRLLAYALEDKLLREPDSQHFSVTHREGDQVGVLAVARERLRQIVAQFAAIGRPLARAYSELQCAPAGDDAWHLALGGELAVLRRSPNDGLGLDAAADGGPPPLLAALLAGHGAAKSPLLLLHPAAGITAPDAKAWGSALHADVRQGNGYRWHEVPASAANLLQGEFAPRHRRRAWAARLKPALWLAGSALAADLLFTTGHVLWQQHRLSDTGERTAQIFEQTFPNTPPVDPVAQIQRQLDQMRAPRGQLRSDDALTLLAAVADALGSDARGAVQSIKFEDGAIEMMFAASVAPRLSAVTSQLAQRGLIVAAKTDGGAPKLVLRRGVAP